MSSSLGQQNTVQIFAEDSVTGKPDVVKMSAGGPYVTPPDMIPGSIINDEIANLTTTRQKIDYPSGATAVELSYSQGGTSGNTASTGRATYVVFNATSDADADGKLALVGSRKRIALGYDYGQIATDADPITRVDVIAEAAEGGHSTLTIDARIAS